MARTILFFCIVLMQGASLARAADLTWTGCGITKNAFMEELAAAYRTRTGKSVELTGGGATKGIRGVAAGAYDLGGSCRGKMHQKGGELSPPKRTPGWSMWRGTRWWSSSIRPMGWRG